MAEVVAIVGASGVGKTTLLEYLVSVLSARGIRVVTVKTTHHPVFEDRSGTDSNRHIRAGAEATALAGPGFVTLFGKQPNLERLVEALSPEQDLVLVEGGKNSSLRKVEIRHQGALLPDSSPWMRVSRDQQHDVLKALLGLVWREEKVRVHQVCTCDPLYAQERELRNEVLLRPIGLPDHAWETRDSEARHIVASRGELVLGCVLLWPCPGREKVGQLMQMAVSVKVQGQGLGRLLVERLAELAREMGLERIFCHSRIKVVPFYEKLGFAVQGDVFEEVGLNHQKMWLDLTPR